MRDLLALTCLIASASGFAVPGRSSPVRARAAPSMESELAYRKRMEKEGMAGAAKHDAEQAELKVAADAAKAAKAAVNADANAYIDDVNLRMFGARGGGVLTREAIQNAEMTMSPAINAMEVRNAPPAATDRPTTHPRRIQAPALGIFLAGSRRSRQGRRRRDGVGRDARGAACGHQRGERGQCLNEQPAAGQGHRPARGTRGCRAAAAAGCRRRCAGRGRRRPLGQARQHLRRLRAAVVRAGRDDGLKLRRPRSQAGSRKNTVLPKLQLMYYCT